MSISRAGPTSRVRQAHELLYDRDGDSELWHLYTDAFEERFFFEAV